MGQQPISMCAQLYYKLLGHVLWMCLIFTTGMISCSEHSRPVINDYPNGPAAIPESYIQKSLVVVPSESTPVVPDKKTAIQIALAVGTAQYGEDYVKSCKPYEAKLHDYGGKNDTWIVTGTIPKPRTGTLIVELFRQDGRIFTIMKGVALN